MQIEEKMLTKTITKNTKDPYFESLDFMSRLSEIENLKIIEKENNYSTDGPFHRSEVVFELVSHLDDFTHMKLAFFLMGENSKRNYLRLDIVGSFISKVEESGFFSEMFAEFYLENVFPIMRKTAEGKIKNLVSVSEKILSASGNP